MYFAITMNQLPGPGSTPLDALYADYTWFFEQLGCSLYSVSSHTRDIDGLLDHLPIEGVILSGGNDISSEFTGDVERDIRNPAPVRDAIEKKLLSAAIDRKLPVLGICRGMQFINVFFGGRLTQDIATELPGAEGHIRTIHMIEVEGQTTKEWTADDKFTVNSYHHQGIQRHQVSPDLEVFALSKSDRIVEGIYHPHFPIAGVQWHPERAGNSCRENVALMRAFCEHRGYWRKRSR